MRGCPSDLMHLSWQLNLDNVAPLAPGHDLFWCAAHWPLALPVVRMILPALRRTRALSHCPQGEGPEVNAHEAVGNDGGVVLATCQLELQDVHLRQVQNAIRRFATLQQETVCAKAGIAEGRWRLRRLRCLSASLLEDLIRPFAAHCAHAHRVKVDKNVTLGNVLHLRIHHYLIIRVLPQATACRELQEELAEKILHYVSLLIVLVLLAIVAASGHGKAFWIA
mmetsp:Transcript_37610/g.66121  ORF Transcript_37610/g.66121 Transcript_37610/m.66121 type:complete len:223 (-) Transcript_37610:1263-1931(-)